MVLIAGITPNDVDRNGKPKVKNVTVIEELEDLGGGQTLLHRRLECVVTGIDDVTVNVQDVEDLLGQIQNELDTDVFANQVVLMKEDGSGVLELEDLLTTTGIKISEGTITFDNTEIGVTNDNLDAKLSDILDALKTGSDLVTAVNNLEEITADTGLDADIGTIKSNLEDGSDLVNAVDDVPVALNNQIATKVSGVSDPTAVFANSALINNQQTITIAAPSPIRKRHRIIVHNPSTVTDLTVKIFNKIDIGAGAFHHYLGSFVVNAKATVTGTSIETDARNIYDDLWEAGQDIDLVVSNNTALGGSDGFTATVQIYAINNV